MAQSEYFKNYTMDLLEKKIGYSFKDKNILKNALSHKSYTNEQNLNINENYEKLEFLGDAVLELVIRETLIKQYPDKEEGYLSKIKSMLVNKKALAKVAKEISLGKFIFLGKGEKDTKGHRKESILADVLEAIFAGIYLDSNFKTAQKIIKKVLKIKNILLNEKNLFQDYKSLLQEISQEIYKITPIYKILEEEGPAHNKIFKVGIKIKEITTYGKGRSKKIAEQAAAKKALKLIKKITTNEPNKKTENQKHKKFIVPVFIPHQGCKFSCVFCNQKNITGIKNIEIKKQIKTFLSYKKKHSIIEETEIAFFGGTFLGLKEKKIISLLKIAQSFIDKKKASSIRFSTRPDSINDKTLNLLENFSVKTIELGVQSMDDAVLKITNRGHTALDTINAIKMIKKKKYDLGIQIMTGLPLENETSLMKTAKKVATLKPNFLRIYPCIVLKNSALADMYKKGNYKPTTLEESIKTVKKLYLFFKEKKIPIIRMGLQSTESLEKKGNILAGPYHPSFAHLVFSSIFLDMAVEILKKKKHNKKKITIEVHKKNISTMRGIKNSNIKSLQSIFKIEDIKIKSSSNVSIDEIVVL